MNHGIKKGVFVSFFSGDKKLLSHLEKRFDESEILYPIIIKNKRELRSNGDIIINGIEEGVVFLPILTKKSITAQWINQEIGYAKAMKKQMFPIIQNSLLNELKGFIHKEDNQPYRFKTFNNFIESLNNAIEDIEKRFYISLNNLSLKEKKYIREGRMYQIKGMGKVAYLKVKNVIHPIDGIESVKELKKYTHHDVYILDPQNKIFKRGLPIKRK